MARKKDDWPKYVININRFGEEFDPATYVINRDTPGFEEIVAEIRRINSGQRARELEERRAAKRA